MDLLHISMRVEDICVEYVGFFIYQDWSLTRNGEVGFSGIGIDLGESEGKVVELLFLEDLFDGQVGGFVGDSRRIDVGFLDEGVKGLIGTHQY